MTQLYIYLALAIIFFLVAKTLTESKRSTSGNQKPRRDEYSYQLNPNFMRNTEKDFYDLLLKINGDKPYVFFPKVRMEDVVMSGEYERNRKRWSRSTVKSRHFDFLMCDITDLKPVLAIELDGSSHDSFKKIKSDREKDRMCELAGLKLLRVKYQPRYDVEEIHRKIGEMVNSQSI